MIDDRMAFFRGTGEHGGSDLLQALPERALEQLMEFEVSNRIGAERHVGQRPSRRRDLGLRSGNTEECATEKARARAGTVGDERPKQRAVLAEEKGEVGRLHQPGEQFGGDRSRPVIRIDPRAKKPEPDDRMSDGAGAESHGDRTVESPHINWHFDELREQESAQPSVHAAGLPTIAARPSIAHSDATASSSGP